MNGGGRGRLEDIGSMLDVNGRDIDQIHRARARSRLARALIGGFVALFSIVMGLFLGKIVNPAPDITHYPMGPALLLTSVPIGHHAHEAIIKSRLDPRRYTVIAVATIAVVAFVGGFVIAPTRPGRTPCPSMASRR